LSGNAGTAIAPVPAGDAVPSHPRDLLGEVVGGRWRDPDSGEAVTVAIDAMVVAPSLRGREADDVRALGLGRRLALLSDAITHEVLGAQVEAALRGIATVDAIVLPVPAHADDTTVAQVRTASARADALVAVGSGTINDLAKYAAALDGKPYAVFATAPSMNGYTSANAAITVDGHKKTLPATLARGVFVDLGVLAAAPARMIRAGLGDSLCRSTAQVDWLLSHHLLGTPYRQAPFDLLAADEQALLEGAAGLLMGEREVMARLARTLLLSGLGMTLCGGSMPASQGEHLVSHYIDMCAPAARAPFLHGEQVGVATLTMARLQEAMLAGDAPVVQASDATQAQLQRHFGMRTGDACWDEFAPKRLDAQRAAELTQRLARQWPVLRERAAGVQVRADALEATLRRAGAPRMPRDIGLDDAFYAGAVRHARLLRNRYTFLDLADDAGRLAAFAAARPGARAAAPAGPA
jgi:glycerol-1-phosphate dehydrogenase [NAD(P)+]